VRERIGAQLEVYGDGLLSPAACLVATQADIEWLQKAISRSPQQPLTVDVEKQEVRFGDRVIKAAVPDGPRNQLVGGTWDSTGGAAGSRRRHRGDGGEAPLRRGVLIRRRHIHRRDGRAARRVPRNGR